MGSAGLQGFSVLHHGLDGVCVKRTGEAFVGRLHSLYDWNSHIVLGEACVNFEHTACFLFGFFARGVGRVPFLPKELGCAQEHSCAHFPTEHVCPLVDEYRKVAV